MNPQPNYNWMTLSEALKVLPLGTWLWWRWEFWDKGEISICRIGTLTEIYRPTDFSDILVCRALVPEVPSFEEEQSK